MKKKTVIAGIIAAGIILCIIISCIAAANNPRNMVTGALANTARDLAGTDLINYTNHLFNGGSVTVKGNLAPLSGKDADAELKVYTDFSRMRFAAYGNIKEGKTTAASFRGAFNGKDMSFESPLISNKPYGISLRNLQKNLHRSVFNPETGDEDLKLEKNVYEYLTRFYKTVSADRNLSAESQKLFRSYQMRLVSSLLDNARVGTSSDKITAGGQQLNCTVVTLDFDRSSLVNAVSDFVTYAKHDKNLEAYLLKFYSNYDFGIKDADDMVDDFYDKLDSFKRAVKNYDGDMTVWIYITKSGKRIARIDVDTDGKNSKNIRVAYEISLELGKNVKNSEEISFSLDKSTGQSLNISYSVRQNDKTAYKAAVKMTETARNGSVRYNSGLSFKWDKKGGGYTLSMDTNGSLLNLEGKLSKKGAVYDFTFENLETSGRYNRVTRDLKTPISDYNIKLTLNRSDRSPNPPRYMEITKMSAEDYKSFRNDAKKAYEDVITTWFKAQ